MKLSKAIEGFNIARIAEGYSPYTIQTYRSSLSLLVHFLEDPETEDITSADLRRFFYYLRTDYTPRRPGGDKSPLTGAALHGQWKALRSFFNWASIELGIPPVAKELPMPKFTSKEIIPFSEDEIKSLLKSCEYTAPAQTGRRKQYTQRRPTAIRDKALILFLLDTGIRVGECERVRVGDVNLETGEVSILPHGSGQKTKGRTVYLGSVAKRAAWRYLARRENSKDNESFFLSDSGQPLDENAVKSLCRRLGERAGVKKCHPHKFRHTFAIQYLRNGGDVFTLQRLLGHSTLEMVRHYLALVDADSAEAHHRASPADRWKL